ncbi:sigma-70 family RNA polymerase sigma factor [Bacillus sp. DTU_2020_1000418_1_SI_GHA_SEK_038]|uniref:sigma-70 family RNA polymerase sigma factor n=1 Tax=Bacillus sp. DTU_2020_1000418_1_SI_GHA_SEK_038 TaxID=3077585 RepID=UPI0028E482C1|nr:sigma-70 family RNA polymerase sigma factor [Bacillus sp. DTU_2020_1000418_1_SI_GHA_SEK_038]WNS76541.1 sigma-70 family RNA polymerase sigma factor [Bacillus sp. DTU_2020_1000418_1_SI_GHA_SEK_038]
MVEIDIIKKAMKRDEHALLHVLEAYEDVMYRTAFAYLKNEHDAIEAIQETTYRSYKNIHTLKEPRYVGTWLVRILLNVCHDMHKRKSRIELRETLEVEGQYYDSPKLEIVEAISQLPHEQQQLIYLKYFQDMKNNEIASAQNIPEGTVKSRLHTALRKLRHYFSERREF